MGRLQSLLSNGRVDIPFNFSVSSCWGMQENDYESRGKIEGYWDMTYKYCHSLVKRDAFQCRKIKERQKC